MLALHNKVFRKVLISLDFFADKIALLKYFLVGQILIEKGASVSRKSKLQIGSNRNEKYLIELGKNSKVKEYSIIAARTGYVRIGENCTINPFCVLLGYGGIDIGDNVRIAAGCSIVAFNHNFDDPSLSIVNQGFNYKGIKIEDDVWIGTGVRVLDGVTISTGCVVGAGTVVNRSLPPYSVAVGVPARVIKTRMP